MYEMHLPLELSCSWQQYSGHNWAPRTQGPSGLQVRIQAAVKADLRPYWTWNTKLMFVYVELEYLSDNNELNQISFHDDIVRRRPRVNIDRDVKQEYRIVSQDAQLRGRALNATLTWSIMPKVGAVLTPAMPRCRTARRALHTEVAVHVTSPALFHARASLLAHVGSAAGACRYPAPIHEVDTHWAHADPIHPAATDVGGVERRRVSLLGCNRRQSPMLS